MKPIIALLIVMALSFATVDQSYVQVISADGTSTIQKTMDISIFSNQLHGSALQAMAAFCSSSTKESCSVDIASKTLTIKEALAPGNYYTIDTEYGFPFVTQTLAIQSIPNDMFGDSLNTILAAANITGSGVVQPLVMSGDNNASVAALKMLNANFTYTVVMPASVSTAASGGYGAVVQGADAKFDLIQVLSQSQPMVIVTEQINSFVVVCIIGVIVLAALAYSFFSSRPSKTSKKKPETGVKKRNA